MERDILKETAAYAADIADAQVTRFEREVQKNPNAHPEYAQALALLEDAERELIQKLGGDNMATDDMLHACLARAAALTIEMYKSA